MTKASYKYQTQFRTFDTPLQRLTERPSDAEKKFRPHVFIFSFTCTDAYSRSVCEFFDVANAISFLSFIKCFEHVSNMNIMLEYAKEIKVIKNEK